MTTALIPQKRDDYRARAAHTKRVRTRQQILDAVLAAYPGTNPAAPAVVDDILRAASLSRATFYKYFTSLEQAVQALGAELADELAGAYHSIYGDVADPKVRAATGFQLFLSRAAIDPNWASFVSHAHYLRCASGLLRQIATDLRAGVANNDFVIDDMDIAIDLIIGAKAEAMRRLAQVPASRRYIEQITSMILRSLCVAPDVADFTSRTASDRLHAEAPGHLSWWKPFE